MSKHHVWRPHVESPPLLNPFAPATQRNPGPHGVEVVNAEEDADTGAPSEVTHETQEDRSQAKK